MKGMIDRIEKYPVLLAGFCYVLGLFVVTTYLNKYNVAMSVSLFRVNYLMAGIWALIPLLLTFITTALIVFLRSLSNPRTSLLILLPSSMHPEHLEQYEKDYHKAKIFLTVFRCLGFIVPAAIILHIEWNRFEWWIIFFVAFFFVMECIYLIDHLDSSRSKPGPTFNVYLAILSCLVVLLVYLLQFARHGYQYIPANIGGGKPMTVRLSIKPDEHNIRHIKGMGVPITKGNIITDPCKLIYTTDDEYIILVGSDGKEHAVTIRRGITNGVIYSNVPRK